MVKLLRYRFKSKAVDDCRPLIDMANIQMPWWCTGAAGDGSYVTIVCYLPESEDLFKYWDDAFDIESEYRDTILYTNRFAKPEWIK